MTGDTFDTMYTLGAAWLPGPNSSAAERGADLGPSEATWENEGGHFSGFDGPANRPVSLHSPGMSELERQTEYVLAMTRALSSDYANGRIGLHHNTFEHRSRVLRQQTAKLDAMRQRQAIL